MTSDCRGEKRITSEPNRAISYRLAPAAINSMAQQASPIGIGQSEFFRNQLIAASSCVTTTSPSILELYDNSVVFSMCGPEERLVKATYSRQKRQARAICDF